MGSKTLLDYDYTKQEHIDNVSTYYYIKENLIENTNFQEVDFKSYYSNLYSLFFLTEWYIENNIKDIRITINAMVEESYCALLKLTNKEVDQIAKELFEIYDDKNWDYGNSSENQLRWDGIYSFKVTIEHKICRIDSFYKNEELKVEDEKIKDTIGDLINYCYIYLIWAEKGFPMGRNIEINVD